MATLIIFLRLALSVICSLSWEDSIFGKSCRKCDFNLFSVSTWPKGSGVASFLASTLNYLRSVLVWSSNFRVSVTRLPSFAVLLWCKELRLFTCSSPNLFCKDMTDFTLLNCLSRRSYLLNCLTWLVSIIGSSNPCVSIVGYDDLWCFSIIYFAKSGFFNLWLLNVG